MENVIIVPSYQTSEQVLLEEQKIWSASNVSDTKIDKLEYLVVYRVKDSNYTPHQQGTLYGLYKILGYMQVSDNFAQKAPLNNHINYGKYIFFVEKQQEIEKESPRVYQDRDYMSYEDFVNLPSL